jgi:hypothetical protein
MMRRDQLRLALGLEPGGLAMATVPASMMCDTGLPAPHSSLVAPFELDVAGPARRLVVEEGCDAAAERGGIIYRDLASARTA